MADASAPVTAPVTAVVLVRGLPAGKRRLAALLSVAQRNGLVRAMLEDVVHALQAAPSVDRVVICSRDAAAKREAELLGADFLQQPGDDPSINHAVAFAQDALADAPALLIVPADVPLITPAAVDALVATAAPGPGIALAPAHNGGTNGMLLRPPGIIAPLFGPSSARAHRQAGADAGDAGVPVRMLQADVWEHDIDSPADLRFLAGIADQLPDGIAPATRAWLAKAELAL